MKTLAENLKKKGYIVECFETIEEACLFLNKELDGTTIGIGGSQTVDEMGLDVTLAAHNTVYWHHKNPGDMTVTEARQAAFRAPVYISSVNGISEQGVIINIDGTGNRVAATSYGPQDIYFIIGKNKVAENFEAAMWRARNIASPKNAQRLHCNTPCAVKGDKCYDCDSPGRICRIFTVLQSKPFGSRYHVILVNENLGY